MENKNNKKRGIKRHEALKPLSRHHMIALHLALKLSRAGTDESKLTVIEIKQELIDFWIPNGQQHFREEEEILLIAFAQHNSINIPEVVEMLLEHVSIRALIDTIINTEDDQTPTMHELGKLLELHVRKEERVIFPMIESSLPEEVLQKIAPYLH